MVAADDRGDPCICVAGRCDVHKPGAIGSATRFGARDTLHDRRALGLGSIHTRAAAPFCPSRLGCCTRCAPSHLCRPRPRATRGNAPVVLCDGVCGYGMDLCKIRKGRARSADHCPVFKRTGGIWPLCFCNGHKSDPWRLYQWRHCASELCEPEQLCHLCRIWRAGEYLGLFARHGSKRR